MTHSVRPYSNNTISNLDKKLKIIVNDKNSKSSSSLDDCGCSSSSGSNINNIQNLSWQKSI